MSLVQYAFRFYNDDGGEATATPYAAENANISWPLDTNIVLRQGVTHDGSAAPSTSKYMLFAAPVGTEKWFEVSPTGAGKLRLSKSGGSPNNIPAGGVATTQRLSAPNVSPTPAFVSGRLWDDESGLDDVAIGNGQRTELGWCMQALSANGAQNGDQYKFRVLRIPGSGYDAASLAIFAAFTTPPSTQRKTDIDTLVLALKAAGIWTGLDRLYVMAAADSQAALINWISPGTDTLTAVGAPAFTADQGYTGGVGQELDGATAFSSLSHWVQDSASLSIYVGSAGGGSVGGLAQENGTTSTTFESSDGTNARCAINNQFGAISTIANSSRTGFFQSDRSASGTHELYRNGSLLGSATRNSIPVTGGVLNVLIHNGGPTDSRPSLLAVGASQAGNVAAYYAAVQAYMVAVGAN